MALDIEKKSINFKLYGIYITLKSGGFNENHHKNKILGIHY